MLQADIKDILLVILSVGLSSSLPYILSMRKKKIDTVRKFKDGLIFIIEHDPPYLIHCEAGIDRTGFLSMLLEAFTETQFDDIVKDYMLSYVEESEYSLNDYKNGSMFIMNIFGKIKGEIINPNEDLQHLSTNYLLEKIKLSVNEVKMLSNRIMNKNI